MFQAIRYFFKVYNQKKKLCGETFTKNTATECHSLVLSARAHHAHGMNTALSASAPPGASDGRLGGGGCDPTICAQEAKENRKDF